ncbi:MAG: hypothetical protein V1813_01565 [Candidatus Aenigmatarchaeota archaeon]
MDRRSFIKTGILGAAGVIAGPYMSDQDGGTAGQRQGYGVYRLVDEKRRCGIVVFTDYFHEPRPRPESYRGGGYYSDIAERSGKWVLDEQAIHTAKGRLAEQMGAVDGKADAKFKARATVVMNNESKWNGLMRAMVEEDRLMTRKDRARGEPASRYQERGEAIVIFSGFEEQYRDISDKMCGELADFDLSPYFRKK